MPSMPAVKILLVEHNPGIIEMLIDAFVRRLEAQITCVATAEDALDVEIIEPHQIVVADTALPRMDAITLTRRLMDLQDRPVILMGREPNAAEIIAAMRSGAIDYFTKPFELDAMLTSVERAIERDNCVRSQTQRYHRMRHLVRRVIKERRELNERVDLICRDLVGAHKRLVLRVLDYENAAAAAISAAAK